MVVLEALALLRRPGRFRAKETVAQFEAVGLDAIPIVALVTFLIGVVFAYLLGVQAQRYGANIFVVDGVGLAVCRELSPLLAAVIVAGRSGAAFTAQLGTMKVQEEIDAISTLGLSPVQVLVIPRLAAIVVALPALVFVGDVAGIAGGMLVGAWQLDIGAAAFLDRLHAVLPMSAFVIGVAKAPVFGAFIAMIACRMGLLVARDARSVGESTTSTVVQSIVWVIVLDAMFAVALPEPGHLMERVLEADSVVTRFGAEVIHDRVSFTVGRGEVVALIGGSGTGKSVLLKEAIGLIRPSGGTIRLLGTDVWRSSADELNALRRRFGMLFQDGALFSSLTVAENIAVPFRENTDLPMDLIAPLVGFKLALVGLAPDAGKKTPAQISGGMRKRVALARALALEPEILFLDEPTSGLDPVSARAFDALVRVLSESLGLTVFIVTHDLDTLLSIIDRAIVLSRAKVIADGPVGAVMQADDPWIRDYFSARARSLPAAS